MSLQTPGFRRRSSWVKPACWDSMSSAACVMMPPCGIHMTVSAQASVDGRVSKARRLILRNSTFSVARFSTLKKEGLTQSRHIQRQWNATSKSWSIIRNREDIKSFLHRPWHGGQRHHRILPYTIPDWILFSGFQAVYRTQWLSGKGLEETWLRLSMLHWQRLCLCFQSFYGFVRGKTRSWFRILWNTESNKGIGTVKLLMLEKGRP